MGFQAPSIVVIYAEDESVFPYKKEADRIKHINVKTIFDGRVGAYVHVRRSGNRNVLQKSGKGRLRASKQSRIKAFVPL